MKFGFVTNCLGKTTLADAVEVAVQLGFDCLEVGPTIHRDCDTFRAIQDNGPVTIHSFIYGRNFLSRDRAARQTYHSELMRLLELAVDVGVAQITTSTGVDSTLSLGDNIAAVLEFWGPVLDQALAAGVRIALEFCPTSGNFALGPYAWRQLLAATASWPNFGLSYDPSHLLWQFIDPYTPLTEFGKHIFSLHAKDTIVHRDILAEHGILTPYSLKEESLSGLTEHRAVWWEYCIPGTGELDWMRLLADLYATGYTGALILEHESPRYMGSRQMVLEGLRLGLAHLRAGTEAAGGPTSTSTAGIGNRVEKGSG